MLVFTVTPSQPLGAQLSLQGVHLVPVPVVRVVVTVRIIRLEPRQVQIFSARRISARLPRPVPTSLPPRTFPLVLDILTPSRYRGIVRVVLVLGVPNLHDAGDVMRPLLGGHLRGEPRLFLSRHLVPELRAHVKDAPLGNLGPSTARLQERQRHLADPHVVQLDVVEDFQRGVHVALVAARLAQHLKRLASRAAILRVGLRAVHPRGLQRGAAPRGAVELEREFELAASRGGGDERTNGSGR
mmetsp:Transcript_4996/g.22529  ORF Transcript_4996/g.22529 Transcript_4996/m.22529 type:complete len:242 (-) Transcript_4996:2972-3697(-)